MREQIHTVELAIGAKEEGERANQARPGGSRIGLLCAVAAAAFGSSGAPLALAEESAMIEEIVVSARRRSESIQDVPVAVTAIEQELKRASVRRLEDVQNFAPNIYIRRTPGIASGAAISIRGVTSTESDKSFDPAIGVMMDGMFLGTSSGVLLQNFDIKQIEVLRGPQGTLFGKNTTGGLLNIIRGDVTMEWGADINVTAGNFGRQDLKAVVNMPLVGDQLGLKVFGASIESDGFVRNSELNDDVGGDDILDYGFTALWEPNDTFNLKLHYEKFIDESEQGAYTNVNQVDELACTLELIGLGETGCESSSNDGPDRNSADGRNDSDNEYDTFIVTANLDLENFLVTYVGSSRDMDENNNQHFDGAPVDLLRMRFFNDWHQKSHELRVTSQFSDRFEFVAGLFYWEVDYEQRWDVSDLFWQLSRIGAFPPATPTILGSNGQNQTTESQAVFFSADWHISDAWTLTAGARWTEEEKDFTGGSSIYYDPAAGDPVPPLNNPVDYNETWDEVTPMVSLRYQPTDDLMLFGSFSRGFKSGGFFGRQANFNIDPTYDPEYVNNYELGMKSTLLDNRLIFNAAVFLSQYEDKQESILIPIDLTNVATVVRNASELEMFGVELEAMFQVTNAWFLRASYGYLDAEYDNYFADITGDGIVTDNSNLRPRSTPENTFGLTTTYSIQIGSGELEGMLSYRWRDEIEMLPDNGPLGSLDAIDNLSATISYLWSDDRYRATVFGRNITDERERMVGTIGGLTTRGWYNEGFAYGLEFAASL